MKVGLSGRTILWPLISWNSTHFPGQQQGREGLKQVISAFRTVFPDIHWVIEEMVAEGDKVFSRFTWHGTHRGEFLGIPATGRQISVKGMVVDHVVAGKMAESRLLMDGLSMMSQLCVIAAQAAVTWPEENQRDGA
jgi:steroid delta-isomerase-like uncharacterized protein